MIDYFQLNPHAFWFSLGFALLAIEAVVLGLSTGVVLFAGLGALITGFLLWAGWLAPQLSWEIASFGVSSALVTGLLWKPMRMLQGSSSRASRDTSSDLVGYRFQLQQTVSRQEPGQTRYSGISWRVEIDETCPLDEILVGQQVEVCAVAPGLFRVSPVSD